MERTESTLGQESSKSERFLSHLEPLQGALEAYCRRALYDPNGVADVLLFASADAPRILLNIGGMANLTYVERRAQDHGVLAFDTGPGVAIIDATARMVDGTATYDRDGQIAARGTADRQVLGEVRYLMDTVESGLQQDLISDHELLMGHFSQFVAPRPWVADIQDREDLDLEDFQPTI
jgi:hypothetical protein